MAQFAPVEKEWDFYSKSLLVSLSLPCTWEVLTYYNFYLCMCMCVHVCIWACMYVWICIYMWKPEDSTEFHSSGDVSRGLSIPWSLTRQVDQPGKPRGPPASNFPLLGLQAHQHFICILGIKFRPLCLLTTHFSSLPLSLFYIFRYSGNKLARLIQVKDREENYDH